MLNTNIGFTHSSVTPLGSLADAVKAMHKYGAHVVLLHVSLAKLQLLSAAVVCALTHWLRGKSGKLLIVVITDIQLLSHMHCVCSLFVSQKHT